ncbi:MAG: YdbH domain-containing protein [Pseudomonadales bacterium]
MSEHPEPARRLRRALRATALTGAVAAAFLLLCIAGGYAGFPWLVARLAPGLLEAQGFTAVQVSVGRPQGHGLPIDRVRAQRDGLQIEADAGWLEYRPGALLHGRIDGLRLQRLSLAMVPDETGATTGSAALAAPDPEQLFALLPVASVQVDELALAVPRLDFSATGSLSLTPQALALTLDGVTPAVASRFSASISLARSGAIAARFSDAGVDAAPFIELSSQLTPDTLRIDARYQLHGFALALLAEILGLPPGAGELDGEARIHLPWPLPETLDFEAIAASGPLRLNWRAEDQSMEVLGLDGSFSLAAGVVDAELGGRLRYRAGNYLIEATLPAAQPLHFDDAVLTTPKGIALSLSGDALHANLAAGPLRLVTQPLALSAGGELAARNDTLSARGRLTASVDRTANSTSSALQGALSLAGSAGFAGQVEIADWQVPTALEVKIAGDTHRFSATGVASAGALKGMALALHHDLANAETTLDLQHQQRFARPLLESVLTPWRRPYDVDSGDLQLAVSARLAGDATPTATATARVELSGGAAHYEDLEFQGAAGVLELRYADGIEIRPSPLQAASFDFGVALTDLKATISGSLDTLTVAGLQAQLLGGSLRSEPFAYQPDTGSAQLQLDLEGLDLAQVLALQGDDISGTGRLDGTVPVQLRDNTPSVSRGRVNARPPGGVIQVSDRFSTATGQPGLDFALLALRDFRYSLLDADVDYAENGDLALAVHLEGRNPAVEKGRAIHYNLGINQNLPLLLESLRLQDRVTSAVERKVTH